MLLAFALFYTRYSSSNQRLRLVSYRHQTPENESRNLLPQKWQKLNEKSSTAEADAAEKIANVKSPELTGGMVHQSPALPVFIVTCQPGYF